MRGIRIHVYHHPDPVLAYLLGRIQVQLDDIRDAIEQMEAKMARNMDHVLEEIRESKTVQDGMAVMIREIRATLESKKGDEAKVEEAIALLDTMQAEGGAVLVEGTAAADEPAPTPVEE